MFIVYGCPFHKIGMSFVMVTVIFVRKAFHSPMYIKEIWVGSYLIQKQITELRKIEMKQLEGILKKELHMT